MLTTDLNDLAIKQAQAELARRSFFDYCQTMHPAYYADDREYLKYLCDMMQWFYEQNDKRFLVINMPPRHFKSFTGSSFVEWVFGKRTDIKTMTGSYNETLSTTFARKVRDTIDARPLRGGPVVYRSIFPKTKIKYGQASASLWALEGSTQDNYLATSPTGTATGFGANLLLIDDIIKNAEEAYNDAVLEKQWQWFANTMMQRLEGDDYKVIVIMTRWATQDLAGRIIANYGDLVEHVTFKALQDDGTMLCPEVLNKTDYLLKTKEMNAEIIAANYQQEPIDVKGRLYDRLMTYAGLPDLKDIKVWNYTDTADKGKDWLCSIDYVEKDGDVYVLDLVMTDAQMEVTEPLVAAMLFKDKVNEAIIESNNGGRGFGRNIYRLLADLHNTNLTVITDKNQTSNKEARILSSSAWVKNHIYMPPNWHSKYPEFYAQVLAYQKKGKNAHDDAVDVLAGIYEAVTGPQKTFRMSL